MNSTTSKLTSFVRALLLLVVVAVAVPWLLMWAANRRFGGPAPWSAMPPVGDWSASTIGDALTDRLSEATIADIVIRLSLTVVWLAVIVLLVTVVAELVHMVRHAGIAMPRIRGLGPSQDLARVIAAGLLVVVPMFSSSTAIADDSPLRLPDDRAPATLEARPDNAWIGDGVTSTVAAAPAEGGNVEAAPTSDALPDESVVPVGSYTVRPGDSVYGIAERLAGPDQASISALANDILDLNLGRRMIDGQLFSNAAYIDVGWELRLPPSVGVGPATVAPTSSSHVVEEGESLWSIADDELGDGSRWPEIYEVNEGRTFDDGRHLSDPDIIQPGWELDMPGEPSAPSAPEAVEESPTPTEVPVTDADVPVASDSPEEVDFVDGDAGEQPTPSRRDNSWLPTSSIQPVLVEGGADHGDDDARPDEPTERAAPAPPTEPVAAASPHIASPGVSSEPGSPGRPDADPEPADIELLTLERAAMLSAGVLTLLGVRRRRRMREAPANSRLPAPSADVVRAERALRTIDAGERFARVDIAIRAAAMPLVEQDARVLATAVGPDGDIELWASSPCHLDAPWEAGVEPNRWLLPASTPVELLAPDARRVGAPCPTLVQLGTCDDGRDLYVDLEAIEAIEVGGPGAAADSIVAAVAATLSTSVLAEVTTLVGIGVADDAFLGHRHHRPARSVQEAFSSAADAVGSTARAQRSTFDLRARVTSGEMWEPAVVLVGAAAGTVTPPANRTGLAVVSASPIHGPSARLAPEDGTWVLRPLDVRLTPIGLSAADVVALASVVDVAEPQPIVDLDDDRTMAPSDFDDASWGTPAAPTPPERLEPANEPLDHALVVRLLGPVSVESADGRQIEFERSKTKELIAWLVTHRDRSTRSNARAALWELDVRDATFSNVVSEARRAMARCVEPPDGEEWLGRTMTDSLPLHPLVVSDIDLVEHALDAARLQPPAQAIATLRGALDWIRSVPFEGTSYLWPDAEGITSALVLRAITLTSALADHCLSVGDVDGVFEATSRGLQVLPAHEEMIAVRMRAYAKVGDRAGIRHEWESYERAITADPWSDGEPSPKMLDLRRELL